jgi:excisionase family DNA binding protein
MIPRPTIKSHGRAVVEAIDAADAAGDALYTTREVAATLRVHPATVQGWVQAGAIPAIHLPGKATGTYLIRHSDLKALIARSER